MMDPLPIERMEGLRQLIHEQVARSDIHDKVWADTYVAKEGSLRE